MGRALRRGEGVRHYERLSLWHDTVDTVWTPRPALHAHTEADVAIVGAGLTGLWTAHYLAAADPDLRIVVLEAEVAGFGASGRSGGWCTAPHPAPASLAAGTEHDAPLAQHRAMRATVDEVVRAAAAEGIDAQVAHGGTIALARGRAQWARARAEVAEARSRGRAEDDLRLLDRAEAITVLRGSRTRGATYTPGGVALHPARLVRGLADAVERRGVVIHERTPVTAIEPHLLHTADAVVRARTVIRATEGYTASLRGQRRTVAAVHSHAIATEPLSPDVWDEIGLARRETFTDHGHLVVHGQRTADDRLVLGGRGAAYHLGSRVRPDHDRDERAFAGLYAALVDLLPVLHGARVTHAWGGPLGIARDGCASVGMDPDTGIGWAGGYGDAGLGAANLAGRTLRDLVLGDDTELTRLPWVGHRSPAWGPEPLRWLGLNARLRATRLADAEESVTRMPSLLARAVGPLPG